MPEGDTVYQTAQRLRKALAGHVIEHCRFRTPTLATTDLTGYRVTAIRSRGKHLLIDLADPSGTPGPAIHSHLKMDGSWQVHRIGRRWARPAHLARIELRTDRYEAVGFELGTLELLADPDAALAHLGPDLLADDWDAAEAIRRIEDDPDRPIGLALLDQRLLAGVGNVYRSEVCFLRGVHPRRRVAEVDVPAMVELCRRVLWANRNRAARVTTGMTAPNARLWVYGRAGHPCRRCGTPIRREQLGPSGSERVIFVCPTCQR